ncbi:MAG: hypothetical protein H7Z14_10400 [Anaerolineae bacterium]|nr:hypothetical protein [Phycisphaerae bacterium]
MRSKRRDFAEFSLRSYDEVAEIMASKGHPMSRASIWYVERRALQKLFVALIDDAPHPEKIKAQLQTTSGVLRARSRLPRMK